MLYIMAVFKKWRISELALPGMSTLVDFTKHRSSRRVKFVTFLVSLISQGGAGTKKLVETLGKKRGKSIILVRTDFFKGYFVFSAAGIKKICRFLTPPLKKNQKSTLDTCTQMLWFIMDGCDKYSVVYTYGMKPTRSHDLLAMRWYNKMTDVLIMSGFYCSDNADVIVTLTPFLSNIKISWIWNIQKLIDTHLLSVSDRVWLSEEFISLSLL